MNYYNRDVKITYKDGRQICAGKCIAQKFDPMHLISIDNKHFFNINSDNLIIEIADDIQYDEIKIFEEIKVAEFRFIHKNMTGIDVYVERDETELDPEVEKLVVALNKIEGLRTTGSCSGHGIMYPWVIIEFEDINALTFLIMILQNNIFNNNFVLRTDKNIIMTDGANPSLKLECKKMIPDAETLLNRLAMYIEVKHG